MSADSTSDAPLSTYQSMRDFGETPEPAGAVGSPPAEGPRFVIQEHHATALHWDLRLERHGVLVSWALPKGIPPDPRVNHLAVHTEDHPLEYLSFHGQIPSGNYGAGTMTIWDTGTYEIEKWADREVIVVLHGEKAKGRHVLFQTRGKQWMIHRMDPPADPGREVWPGWAAFEPMIAVPGDGLPAGPYGVEFAWGGLRALTYVSGGRVQLRGGPPVMDWGKGDRGAMQAVPGSGAGDAVPAEAGAGGSLAVEIWRFGELRPLGEALGVTEVVLDGELIVVGDDGRPSPERLAQRLAVRSDSAARRLAGRHRATLMIFDLLWLDGHRMISVPYAERRRLLEGLKLAGPAWQVPASYSRQDGAALLLAAGQQGLPGVIAKHRESQYRPGPADGEWVFVPA